ncbi:hypothetical protein LTR94_029276, partial [Friedmanniomyces endolithicus]
SDQGVAFDWGVSIREPILAGVRFVRFAPLNRYLVTAQGEIVTVTLTFDAQKKAIGVESINRGPTPESVGVSPGPDIPIPEAAIAPRL